MRKTSFEVLRTFAIMLPADGNTALSQKPKRQVSTPRLTHIYESVTVAREALGQETSYVDGFSDGLLFQVIFRWCALAFQDSMYCIRGIVCA